MKKLFILAALVASAHISASSVTSEIRVTTLVLLVTGCVSVTTTTPLPVVRYFLLRFDSDGQHRFRLLPALLCVQVNAAAAGSNLIGKFGIDQTTPGTTNLVSIGTNGTVNPTTVLIGVFLAATSAAGS